MDAAAAADGDDNNHHHNNSSNNVKVENIYYGIPIKIFAPVVRMYLSDRKNLLGDRQHRMISVS